MRNKRSKKFKGMTLVEIIISLAIVSLLTVLLASTSNLINNYVLSTNRLNEKVALQSPTAETQYTNNAYEIDDSVEIVVNNTIIIKGKAYSVSDPADTSHDDEINGRLNFKFITDLTTT